MANYHESTSTKIHKLRFPKPLKSCKTDQVLYERVAGRLQRQEGANLCKTEQDQVLIGPLYTVVQNLPMGILTK